MPVPTGAHPVALIGRGWAVRINRIITAVAARHAGVVAVETEPFGIEDMGGLVVDPAYYANVAHRLAPALLDLLGVRAPRAGRHVALV